MLKTQSKKLIFLNCPLSPLILINVTYLRFIKGDFTLAIEGSVPTVLI